MAGTALGAIALAAPGETVAAYHARVEADVNAGLSQLQDELPDANTQMWAVPWNDLAQAPNQEQSGPQTSKWLNSYATGKFAVVFVDGFRSVANEHYRLEAHGTDSLSSFAAQLRASLAEKGLRRHVRQRRHRRQ